MQRTQAIGLFDSGIGGTSIWKEINRVLPNEDTIYLSDSKNAPYGQKSKDEILHICKKNTEFLIAKGCKIIVVACNTATTNSIDYLRANYPVPFIGIEPAIKPAALLSKTGAIGILATKGTLSSKLFAKTTEEHSKNVTTVEQVGDGIVTLIEDGNLHSTKMTELLMKYLTPMQQFQIDHLVLGCTHYPYLIPQIKTILGNDVKIIDSGEAVARQTKAILKRSDLLSKSRSLGNHEFFTNTDPKILSDILGPTNGNRTIKLLVE